MGEKKYSLRILPLFEDDFNDIVDYIVFSLNNPSRLKNHLMRGSILHYYRIYVSNYIVYYVVINDVMEVRRIIYNKKKIASEL